MVSLHPWVGETQWGPVNKGHRALPHLTPLTSRYIQKKMVGIMMWYGNGMDWSCHGMMMKWSDDIDGVKYDDINGMVWRSNNDDHMAILNEWWHQIQDWKGWDNYHPQYSSGDLPYPWWSLVEDNGCHKIKVAVLLQGHSLPYHKINKEKKNYKQAASSRRLKYMTDFINKPDH